MDGCVDIGSDTIFKVHGPMGLSWRDFVANEQSFLAALQARKCTVVDSPLSKYHLTVIDVLDPNGCSIAFALRP